MTSDQAAVRRNAISDDLADGMYIVVCSVCEEEALLHAKDTSHLYDVDSFVSVDEARRLPINLPASREQAMSVAHSNAPVPIVTHEKLCGSFADREQVSVDFVAYLGG